MADGKTEAREPKPSASLQGRGRGERREKGEREWLRGKENGRREGARDRQRQGDIVPRGYRETERLKLKKL